jgi:Zn-finger nucleic acid-binding protein
MMTCPKCPGAMRSYERNGVHVDQCDTCRGIFLDHGELEALTRAEAQWSAQNRFQGSPVHGGHHGGPGWGDRRQRRGGFGRFLFSS